MSLQVIELNDAMLSVGDASGMIWQSPGFALVQDKNVILGDAAEQKARLHPTQSFSKYWHELSLDPLSQGNHIRHYADLAYAQLLDVARQGGIDGDVLLAVPGNFTRQQLAIILGLVKSCPFEVVGVVDSALVAAAAKSNDQQLIYAELQLHQVVLTRLESVNGQLAVDSLVQIPGVGSQNMIDQLMQLATNAFIQQCRFNPQHNAESEQQLYNSLPHWWRQTQPETGNLTLELHVGETVHTAKIPRETLITCLTAHYQKIQQHLTALAQEDISAVLLNAGLAALPGLLPLLQSAFDITVVKADDIIKSTLDHAPQIRTSETGITLIHSLRRNAANTAAGDAAENPATGKLPTHILYQHHAIALTSMNKVNGHAATIPVLPGKLTIKQEAVYFDSGSVEFLLNTEFVKGMQKLALGDCIQLAPDSAALTLIRVQ